MGVVLLQTRANATAGGQENHAKKVGAIFAWCCDHTPNHDVEVELNIYRTIEDTAD